MFTTRTFSSLAAIALLGVASALGGCSSDDTKATTTPISGTLTGSFNGEPCGAAGSTVAITIEATGDLTGLGTVTLTIDETATCESEQGLAAITDVAGKYTTSNGDELRFSGTGSDIAIDTVAATAAYTSADTFSGGTGRFAKASGHETVTLSHGFTDMVLTVIVDGEVSVPG